MNDAGADRDPVPSKDDDFVPIFRAIKTGDTRRGIRLERIYWKVLPDVAASEGVSLARYIDDVSHGAENTNNLTSVLRVNAAKWLQKRLAETQRHTGLQVIDSLVQASPSPAIALHEDKRIVSYNQSFLNYIQSRFSRFSAGSMASGLRLSLDMPISDLADKLKAEGGRPVRTGFVLGLYDQRLRGELSTTLGPWPDKTTILGFVVHA